MIRGRLLHVAISLAVTAVLLALGWLLGSAPAQAQAQQADSELRVTIRHTAVGTTPLPSTWDVSLSGSCWSESRTAVAAVELSGAVVVFDAPAEVGGIECDYFASLAKNDGWLSAPQRRSAFNERDITFTVVPADSLEMSLSVECYEEVPGVNLGTILVELTKHEASEYTYYLSTDDNSAQSASRSQGVDISRLRNNIDATYSVSVQADYLAFTPRYGLLTEEVVVDCNPGDVPPNFDGQGFLGIEDRTPFLRETRPQNPYWNFDIEGSCLEAPVSVRIPGPYTYFGSVLLPHQSDAGELCTFVATAVQEPGWYVPEPTMEMWGLRGNDVSGGSPSIGVGAGFPQAYSALPVDFDIVVYTDTRQNNRPAPGEPTVPTSVVSELSSSCLAEPLRFATDNDTIVAGDLVDYYDGIFYVFIGELVTLEELPVVDASNTPCLYDMDLLGITRSGVERDPANYRIGDGEPFTIYDITANAFQVEPLAPEPQVGATSYCAGGSGRVDVTVVNASNEPMEAVVTIGGLAPRTRTVAASSVEVVFATGRRDGELAVRVEVGGEVWLEQTELIDCYVAPSSDDPIVTSTCLHGNGRIDVALTNLSAVAVEYHVTIGRLAPRAVTVQPNGEDRVTATGRTDGINAVFVVRDGVPYWSEPTIVDCDPRVPGLVTWSCLAERARIDAVVFNTTGSDATFEVTVGSVPTRSVTVAAGDSAIVSVSGRRDGPHLVTIFQDGQQVHKRTEQVRCSL